MAKKPAMGKGVDAILGKSGGSINELQSAVEDIQSGPAKASSSSDSRLEIPIALIDRNPLNPRTDFDPAGIAELAATIRAMGIINPLMVQAKGDRYELIAGERRLRAAKELGLETVPVIISPPGTDPKVVQEIALVENIQREDLNALDVAYAFQALIDEFSITQEQLAERVGKNRATVTNFLRLLKLPEQVQALVRAQKISQGHARALLGLPNREQQEGLAEQIVEQGLSVRAVEALVKQLNEAPGEKELKSEEKEKVQNRVEGYVESMQKNLYELLGYGAKVKAGKDGSGKVVISFRSEEERLELMEKLNRLK